MVKFKICSPSGVIECGWDKRTLERQIHSYYFVRMLKSQNPQKKLQSARQEVFTYEPAVETLKPILIGIFGASRHGHVA
jgi:predicted nuclease of restriction endonuclease-like (RecB) superfamily